jgi:hypothetical protein
MGAEIVVIIIAVVAFVIGYQAGHHDGWMKREKQQRAIDSYYKILDSHKRRDK